MSDRSVRLVGESALVALMAGGLISVLAFFVARYGPSGGDWSFKGNGAITVYTALPGVLAGGFTALAQHARHHPRWLVSGIVAGVVGLAIALVAAAILPVFGTGADRVLTPIVYIALVLWMFAAPAWAARRGTHAVPIAGYWPHVAAGAGWLVATLVGLVIVGIVLPAGS